MVAPALAASRAEEAICAGVTGTSGLLPVVSPAPVTAHVMMAFLFIPRRFITLPWYSPGHHSLGTTPTGIQWCPYDVPLRRAPYYIVLVRSAA